MDTAELLLTGVEQPLERSGIRGVRGHRERPPPALPHFGGYRLDPVGAAAGDDHIGARVGETEGEHAADAARASYYDGRSAAEIE